MPASATFFTNYVRNYLLCCIFPDKTYNPTIFEPNHLTYHACFGAFHVIDVLPKLVILKTSLLLFVLIYEFLTSDDDLLRLCGLFGFSIAATANVILLVGIHYKRYTLTIPYFFMYVLLAFCMVLLLFVKFLDTANSKDTLTAKSLLHNFSLLIILIFEVYTILLVWRLFVYICDFCMDEELKAKERSRRVAEHLRLVDRRDCISVMVHVPGDPD
ncbi:hypothetical protein Aduo_011244 [Ancylostoma duodenale]